MMPILSLSGLVIAIVTLHVWGLLWYASDTKQIAMRISNRIGAVVFSFLFLVILIFISAFAVSLSYAAEDSAPATPPVATETSTALCPTEFNIDDSAWAMIRIEDPRVKEFAGRRAIVEHIRVFSYFPDVEKRIFVGIKKLWNPDCVATLHSHGLPSDVDGKRVAGTIKSHGKMTAFLLTDKGWESGDNLEMFTTDDCGAQQCDIVFALYRNKTVVASRTLVVKQVPVSDWLYERLDHKPAE